MKKKMILATLIAAALAIGQAQASPLSLDDAVISASYQGATDGILGFYGSAGDAANVSRIDGTEQVEFMTTDALFAFDFSSTGLVSIYANMPPDPAGLYNFTFDFGNSLSMPITSFTLANGSAVDLAPVLSVIDGHTIGVDLSQLTWSGDYTPVTAQLASAPAPSNVPEPASLALVLAGTAGLGLSRRARRG